MKTEYTIKELSDRLNVSTRTVERYLKNLYTKEKNRIMIPLDVVELLELRHNSDTTPTEVRQEEYDVIEGFTNEEYEEFKTRLIEYPALKEKVDYLLNDIEYHKKQIESHNRQMEIVLRNMEQRNFIEAKDKKLDQ